MGNRERFLKVFWSRNKLFFSMWSGWKYELSWIEEKIW